MLQLLGPRMPQPACGTVGKLGFPTLGHGHGKPVGAEGMTRPKLATQVATPGHNEERLERAALRSEDDLVSRHLTKTSDSDLFTAPHMSPGSSKTGSTMSCHRKWFCHCIRGLQKTCGPASGSSPPGRGKFPAPIHGVATLPMLRAEASEIFAETIFG